MSLLFKPYFVEVDDEPPPPQVSELSTVVEEYLVDVKFEDEQYEKADVPDRTFYRFQKRLARAPSQLLRYCFNGTPLWISDKNSIPLIPNCSLCGAKRVFELQLLPTLLNFLGPIPSEKHSKHIPCYLQFGTAVVYSCSASCSVDSYVTEYIVVEEEQ